ncbi:MAG: FdtA/QdtA family cupin domain-containing protein [Reichenbachiella sp.]|uniref:sugar 3,4-ketoisomerase n=1 Tax=Reichenbachiella sp. TaxID=2184521 RepID=UPI003266DA77
MTIPRLFDLPIIDLSSIMTVAEGDNIPFTVKRVYWVTSNQKDEIRGEHAHKSCQQLVACIDGELIVMLEDIQGNKYSYNLATPNSMLLIPSQFWSKIEYKKDCIVLILASHEYDEEDYIRNYSEFRSQSLIQKK